LGWPKSSPTWSGDTHWPGSTGPRSQSRTPLLCSPSCSQIPTPPSHDAAALLLSPGHSRPALAPARWVSGPPHRSLQPPPLRFDSSGPARSPTTPQTLVVAGLCWHRYRPLLALSPTGMASQQAPPPATSSSMPPCNCTRAPRQP
jgi:hypothetical protein